MANQFEDLNELTNAAIETTEKILPHVPQDVLQQINNIDLISAKGYVLTEVLAANDISDNVEPFSPGSSK